jgi:hypothetical protein
LERSGFMDAVGLLCAIGLAIVYLGLSLLRA